MTGAGAKAPADNDTRWRTCGSNDPRPFDRMIGRAQFDVRPDEDIIADGDEGGQTKPSGTTEPKIAWSTSWTVFGPRSYSSAKRAVPR